MRSSTVAVVLYVGILLFLWLDDVSYLPPAETLSAPLSFVIVCPTHGYSGCDWYDLNLHITRKKKTEPARNTNQTTTKKKSSSLTASAKPTTEIQTIPPEKPPLTDYHEQ